MKETKKVYSFKNDVITVKDAECHPRKLPLSSTYIAPYWFQAIQNVYKYQKARELREVHKLVSDDRIKRGYDLYKNKHIVANVTTVHGGDVHATVLSSNKKDNYTVIVKNYLPEKLPQYLHEREEYWANLFIDCTCKDFSMGKFRDNASVICIHVASVLWFLMDKFNMPKIFVLPEEKMVGYQKSDAEEIEVGIPSMPLVKFRYYINILLLKRFRNMLPGLSISIHRISNENDEELGKPTWLTIIELDDVKKLIRGLSKVYVEMAKSQGIPEKDIKNNLNKMLMKEIMKDETKSWRKIWYTIFGHKKK